MIDIRRLKYFLAVAETLHFGKAAERLNMSQPPLSRQIAALEAEMGAALFSRDAHHVRLTPAGQQLKLDAQSIFQSLVRAEANAKAAMVGTAGALAIGFTMCAAYGVVPGYAKSFTAAYPDVDLSLREVLSSDLVEQVAAGDIDAAIVFHQPIPKNLQQRTVMREPLCLALPSSHPLSRRKQVELRELKDASFICVPAVTAPALHRAIVAQCNNAGFEPQVVLEVHLQQTILSLVAEGVGVALVPASMRKLQTGRLTFKDIPGAALVSQHLVWRADNTNPCVENFLRLVEFVD